MRFLTADLARFTTAGFGTVRGSEVEGLHPEDRVTLTDEGADTVEAEVLDVRHGEVDVRIHYPLDPRPLVSPRQNVNPTAIRVDFHLRADPEHTYGLMDDLQPRGPVSVGQRLLASDGEVRHWVVVDAIDREHAALLLRVLWDEQAPAA